MARTKTILTKPGTSKKGIKKKQWRPEDMEKAIKAVLEENKLYTAASRFFNVPASSLYVKICQKKAQRIKKKQWRPEDMEKAIKAVLEENKTLIAASRSFNVPRTTLSKKICQKKGKGIKRHWGEKGIKRHWRPEDMEKAIKAVLEENKSFAAASRYFNVPKTTLYGKIREKYPDPDILTSNKRGRKPIFTLEMEKTLIECCQVIETKFYGLSNDDIKRMAYQLAVRNRICTNLFRKNRAGKKWFYNFVSRYKHLTFMKLRVHPFKLASLHNILIKKNITNFFDFLETEYSKHCYPPHCIFSVGVIGLVIVQSKSRRVVQLKEKKQITALTSAEKEHLVTAVVCMSAGGNFVPPMLIFPCTNWTNKLMKGAPPGAIGKCHSSGWIQPHLLTLWFSHFIDYTKPTATCPVLLILDRVSYVKNLDVILSARDNHVSLLCVPPHTSSKLQPLDRTFMDPLTSYYSEGISEALKTDKINVYDIAETFGKACLKAQTEEIAVNGFKSTGIYPLDRSLFTETDVTEVRCKTDEVDFTEVKCKTEEVDLGELELHKVLDNNDDNDYDDHDDDDFTEADVTEVKCKTEEVDLGELELHKVLDNNDDDDDDDYNGNGDVDDMRLVHL